MKKNDEQNELLKRFEPKQLHEIKTDRQFGIVRFSPCGKFLLAGSYDSLIRRWDFSGAEPQPLEPLKGHRGWVTGIQFLPDGKHLLTTDSWGELRCWKYSGENFEVAWSVQDAHDGWIRALDTTPDGGRCVTGGKDRALRVWSTADGRKLHEFAEHPEDIFAAAIHPGGKHVVSGDLLGKVRHWNLDSGKKEREFDLSTMHHHDNIHDVVGLRILRFTDEGKTLMGAGNEPTKTNRAYGTPTICLLDWASGKEKQKLQQYETKDGFIFDLAWHEGFFLCVTSGTPGTGKFFFRRPQDEAPFYVNKKMSNCHGLAVHPDGRRLVVSATNRNSQGNGAVTDKEGNYLGNSSPLYVFEFPEPAA